MYHYGGVRAVGLSEVIAGRVCKAKRLNRLVSDCYAGSIPSSIFSCPPLNRKDYMAKQKDRPYRLTVQNRSGKANIPLWVMEAVGLKSGDLITHQVLKVKKKVSIVIQKWEQRTDADR